MKGLTNKIAVVTGSAQSIGKACALRFAEEGTKVIVADRVAAQADLTVEEIKQAGGQAISCIVDLETSAGARQMVAESIAEYGHIDIAVHNVGGTACGSSTATGR